jgi:hypothetical protein
MNVLLFGSSGMVGDGVLHVCLADARVDHVVSVGRSLLGINHPKLEEKLRTNFFEYSDLTSTLASTDACFFSLGVSSAGMREGDYHRQTFDLTVAAGRALAAAHPGATFCYVSGEGTDSTERGRSMWARVKGKTENALLALPLAAYMFRPGFIRARQGKTSKTTLYRMLYAVLSPLYPLLSRVAPRHVTTSENIGRAMLAVAINGYPQHVLRTTEINALGGTADA